MTDPQAVILYVAYAGLLLWAADRWGFWAIPGILVATAAILTVV